MSFSELTKKIIDMSNPTVVGLDPKLEFVPNFIKDRAFLKYGNNLKGASKAILEFNKGLIDGLCDIVPAIKPQAAYYEMYGYHGMKTLYKTMEYANSKGMYVITDGKRNDIGTTMEAYATAHLGETKVANKEIKAFMGDALTVNPYLGTDGIKPLLDVCSKYNKGIFVLVKTSNPSSGEFQDRKLDDGTTLYETVADMCEKWGENSYDEYGFSCVGAVVGATYPEQLTALRERMPHTIFLVPGYGAQGGGAKDVVGAFNKDGLGAIVNSSRGIICAYQNSMYSEKEYVAAAQVEAIRMKKDIMQNLSN